MPPEITPLSHPYLMRCIGESHSADIHIATPQWRFQGPVTTQGDRITLLTPVRHLIRRHKGDIPPLLRNPAPKPS